MSSVLMSYPEYVKKSKEKNKSTEVKEETKEDAGNTGNKSRAK